MKKYVRKLDVYPFLFEIHMAYHKAAWQEEVMAANDGEAWAIMASRLKGQGPHHIEKIMLLTSPNEAMGLKT